MTNRNKKKGKGKGKENYKRFNALVHCSVYISHTIQKAGQKVFTFLLSLLDVVREVIVQS